MKAIYCAASLVFLALAARQISMHGKEWKFGRYGIPVSILSPDGRAYADGKPIDPINLAIIQSGNEERAMGVALAVFGGAIIFCGVQIVQVHRITSDSRRCRAWMQEVDRLRSVGKRAEADRLLDRCGEIVERMKRRAEH
jgi:hypothetical protein